MDKKEKNDKVKKHIFCKTLSRENIVRDSLIISVLIIFLALVIGLNRYNYFKDNIAKKEMITKVNAMVQNHAEGEFQNQSRKKIKSIQDDISMDSWKDHQTNWYGFKIKYPQDWKRPVAGAPVGSSGAEYRYSFRRDYNADNKYIGFDIVIYNIKKIKEFTSTGEFPVRRDDFGKGENNCETIEGHLIETGDYSAEEVYIPLGDSCFNPVLFFSVINGQYMYNITPIARDDIKLTGDPMVEISDNLPEFFAVISSFENIDVIRPKSKLNPIINAPHPVSYKRDNLGRKVCVKKKDKPSKSKKDKGRHLDMECCLDPDEYPNPHCYYSPDKYGKYLK